MSEKNVTHEVLNGSIALLTSCLSQPGWTKKAQHLYAAGELIEEFDALGAKPPPELTQEAVADWMSAPFELKLTEVQREACKEALTHFVTSGQIGPSKFFTLLGKSLGLS